MEPLTLSPDIKKRLFSKINKSGPNGCWVWTDSLTRAGYGRFRVGKMKYFSHRLTYTLEKGAIPAGYDIHHKCENPACTNPDHLQPASKADHLILLNPNSQPNRFKAQTHCKHGHEFTPDNIYWIKGKWRGCKQCRKYKPKTLK